MLELKRIHILGFKSFCDRTEVTLDGHGVTVIVGPNGCGKSNISDAISWALGEQSAKTLRGVKMEDVIFAGTGARKATGMAEVSLILVDPEVYQPASSALNQPNGPELVEDDWDEAAARSQAAKETEETIAELQPGQVEEVEVDAASASAVDGPGAAASEDASADASPAGTVVLKVRRRKFQRTHGIDGEVVITRRLFRSGDSEYLLNGKLCRLRDIHDVLMGTGLGSESYGVIEQERIGQLLSSKPHDRRAIIEEAAGITRFKTKKRLAELRLEQAKQNLARVNDIFDEVARQMNLLKRQAAKAERYGLLRDELRQRLRVVIATRLAMLDAASVHSAAELTALTAQIEQLTQSISTVDQQRAAAVAAGYTSEQQARDAAARTNSATVELERTLAQLQANRDRASDLEIRLQAAQAELDHTRRQLAGLDTEREQQQAFLARAQEAADAARRDMQARQAAAQKTTTELSAVDQRIETLRREMLHWMGQANQVRNQITQGEASLEGLERDAERLATERHGVHGELEKLGAERGQVSLTFESASSTLQTTEEDLKRLRAQLETQRADEAASRRQADQLRAEQATLQGRRNSLEALIREHSYSTDTVRKLLRANALDGGYSTAGILADFVEVVDQYENVVDEFLRDELNFIVVKSWGAAQEGMRVLKTDIDGRATFLVHPDDSQAKFSFAPGVAQPLSETRDGVVRLKDCIRVLDGFGKSLEVILPKLRNGYVVPDSETARSLALENPEAFFLAPSGECFHNVTVTGGKPSVEGPLALKRELRSAQQALGRTEDALAKADVHTTELAYAAGELTRQIEIKSTERRNAEQESANTGAALRQLEAEVGRLERRLSEWTLQAERNRQARSERAAWIAERREEVAHHEQERTRFEEQLQEAQTSLESLRATRDAAQQQVSEASVELAGLEERRRGAASSTERLERMYQGLQERIHQLEQQIASGSAEQKQRLLENERLGIRSQELEIIRDTARQEAEEFARQTAALRQQASEVEQQVRALRIELETFRDKRSEEAAHAARLSSDLAHLEETCLQELSLTADELRADVALIPLEAGPLAVEEERCRSIKQKLEAMGPVNMMALDEYKEASERHAFLETQRKDLVDSIENTQNSIREIEAVLRGKFDEAFTAINANFSATFAHLFGGGQAFMKLTDQENTDESGIDIIASPPGKKLQNVLLLSGGEKALTALSLLMAIFQYQPSPFCVLDEVDAALDESNVGRLANMLLTMCARTHFIVITHSKRMMQAADAIFGVTMQEPGVSKIVSVRLGLDKAHQKASA